MLAMSAWLAGITVLILALRAATSELARRPGAAAPRPSSSRCSALATIALTRPALFGVVQAIVEDGGFPALLDSAFGRAVSLQFASRSASSAAAT